MHLGDHISAVHVSQREGPSCDLHISAAAWFWLSAQPSSSCPTDVATGIPPRLTKSHASGPSFSHDSFHIMEDLD